MGKEDRYERLRSQARVKWDCKYHVVFLPKYRIGHFLFDQILIADSYDMTAIQHAESHGFDEIGRILRKYVELLVVRNTRMIEKGSQEHPVSHWYRQRSLAHQALGNQIDADADGQKAIELQSDQEDENP